jgi:hypothetical protein
MGYARNQFEQLSDQSTGLAAVGQKVANESAEAFKPV